MKLELGYIQIKDIVFGNESKISNGVLTVDKAPIEALAKEDDRIQAC